MKVKSFSSIYDAVPHFDESAFFLKREFLTTEKSEFEGKIVSSSVYKVDDPKKRYSGKKVSDFSLENQSTVGLPLSPIKCNPSFLTIDEQIKNVIRDGKK